MNQSCGIHFGLKLVSLLAPILSQQAGRKTESVLENDITSQRASGGSTGQVQKAKRVENTRAKAKRGCTFIKQHEKESLTSQSISSPFQQRS